VMATVLEGFTELTLGLRERSISIASKRLSALTTALTLGDFTCHVPSKDLPKHNRTDQRKKGNDFRETERSGSMTFLRGSVRG
jgi:hypothetical protein